MESRSGLEEWCATPCDLLDAYHSDVVLDCLKEQVTWSQSQGWRNDVPHHSSSHDLGSM